MNTLDIDRPCPEWQVAAWRAKLVAPSGTSRRVLAVLGPEDAGATALERAREGARPLLGRRDAGLLPLVAVLPVGTRVAWVYERVRGLGLGHLVQGEGGALLPLSVAAEAVARVARILIEAGPVGLHHPGPLPDDILLTLSGQLLVGGFVGPFPPEPAMRDPRGATGREAVVYRLGVLFAALVTGQLPAPVGDPAAHDSMVRRTVIRAMGRAEPGFEGRYHDWLVGMLSWDPAARPALGRVAEALDAVGASTGGPTLVEWASREVAHLRAAAGVGPGETADTAPRREDRPDPWSVSQELERTEEQLILAPNGMETLPGMQMGELEEEDDATAESARPGTQIPDHDLPSIPTEKGTIPVGVGPPPEAVRSTPRLPSGFLDRSGPPGGDTDPQLSDDTETQVAQVLPSNRTLVIVSVVLAVLAVAIGIYVF